MPPLTRSPLTQAPFTPAWTSLLRRWYVDAHGNASICKVGRDPTISLVTDGVEGLARLGAIADGLLLRQGGCSGCTHSGSCGTCMPLAALFRQAKAPLANYCQHTEKRKEVLS